MNGYYKVKIHVTIIIHPIDTWNFSSYDYFAKMIYFEQNFATPQKFLGHFCSHLEFFEKSVKIDFFPIFCRPQFSSGYQPFWFDWRNLTLSYSRCPPVSKHDTNLKSFSFINYSSYYSFIGRHFICHVLKTLILCCIITAVNYFKNYRYSAQVHSAYNRPLSKCINFNK